MLARLVELTLPPNAERAVDTALAESAKLAACQQDIVEVCLDIRATK